MTEQPKPKMKWLCPYCGAKVQTLEVWNGELWDIVCDNPDCMDSGVTEQRTRTLTPEQVERARKLLTPTGPLWTDEIWIDVASKLLREVVGDE